MVCQSVSFCQEYDKNCHQKPRKMSVRGLLYIIIYIKKTGSPLFAEGASFTYNYENECVCFIANSSLLNCELDFVEFAFAR